MLKRAIYGALLLLVLAVVGAALFWTYGSHSAKLKIKKTAWYLKWMQMTGQYIQGAEPIAYIYDSRVGVRLKAHTKIHYKTPFFDVSVTTNGDGFTGREYPLETNNFRIAIIGDSAVESYGVYDENRFTALTEQMVYNKTDGKRVIDVMGFGVSGWGTVHAYGALKHFVLKYKPNEVWIMFMSSNDFGDNTPLLNGPPLGPTFVYADASEKKLLDIRFGYSALPQAMWDVRKNRYGADLLAAIPGRWFKDLYPFYFSKQHDPTWDLIERHTYQTFALIKKLADAHNIKVRVVYRNTGYESDEGNFQELKADALKAMNRDIGMERLMGREKFQAKMKELGIGFVDAGFLIAGSEDETDIAKHAGMAALFSDYILKNNLR